MKDYSTKSLTVRKVKTDKKDALKLASFALDRWNELSPFSVQSEARLLLKSYNRQYNQYIKLKVSLKNNLIAILDQTFPGANTLFSTPVRKSDGHEKWVDFVLKYSYMPYSVISSYVSVPVCSILYAVNVSVEPSEYVKVTLVV